MRGTEAQGEHATFSGWAKSSPPLPHLHTSRNSTKKLEPKVTVFRKLLKEKKETNAFVADCVWFHMGL